MAWNKIHTGLNIHRWIQRGFNYTLFDAEVENSQIHLIKAVLTEENIVDEFQKAGIPQEADYVSIDVDSVDVWLLNGMLQGGYYRPRVISVEYNPNFAIDELIACERTWSPWRKDSTVYGSSAAAIHYVASQFDYVPVEIMSWALDMFLVRKDILMESCSNFDELPTFERLGQGTLDRPGHMYCDPAIDAVRLVDVPLSLAGQEEAAKAKAMETVARMNQRRKARNRNQAAFCDESTIHNYP